MQLTKHLNLISASKTSRRVSHLGKNTGGAFESRIPLDSVADV